jgi:hypothetical protein
MATTINKSGVNVNGQCSEERKGLNSLDCGNKTGKDWRADSMLSNKASLPERIP